MLKYKARRDGGFIYEYQVWREGRRDGQFVVRNNNN
jgi:hypothetical protein